MNRSTQAQGALVLLAAIASVTALYLAAAVLAPLVLAFVCAVILSPVSAFWCRLGLSSAAGALLSFACALLLAVAFVLLVGPAFADAYDQFPKFKAEIQHWLTHLRQVLRGINDVTQEMQEAIDPGNGNGGESESSSIQVPAISDALFAAPAFLGQAAIFAGSLFFFILSREEVYDWAARAFPALSRAGPDGCLRLADRQVARYFLTIALINGIFGALVAAIMGLLGMPNAMLWGLMAGLMNFIVYLGPALVALSLAIGGIVVFDGAMTFVPAAIFLSLNLLEGQFVTPTFIGRQMQVNPLLVFLSLCLWLWLWGPIGGFVAIPLLVWGAAICDG